MTRLKKPVNRETAATVVDSGKARPVVVTISPPDLIGFRLKGTRRVYWLRADACYWQAVKASVAAEKRDKALAKGRKTQRRRREVSRGRV